MDTPAFGFISTGGNETHYRVTGDGEPYRLVVRFATPSAHERSIFAGSQRDWDRDVVPTTGTVRGTAKALKSEIVDAFNRWQREEHRRDKAEILANPDKYGDAAKDGWLTGLLQEPADMPAIHYETGHGWRRTHEEQTKAAA